MKLKAGHIPKAGDPELSLVYGNTVSSSFHKAKNWDKNYTIDPVKDTLFYVFPENTTASASSGVRKR